MRARDACVLCACPRVLHARTTPRLNSGFSAAACGCHQALPRSQRRRKPMPSSCRRTGIKRPWHALSMETHGWTLHCRESAGDAGSSSPPRSRNAGIPLSQRLRNAPGAVRGQYEARDGCREDQVMSPEKNCIRRRKPCGRNLVDSGTSKRQAHVAAVRAHAR